jgi:small neutral amino acid transporter SnatA (MarC family)
MADRSKESNIWPVILVSILVGFIFFGNYIFDYFDINLNDRNISEEVKKKNLLLKA